MKITAMVSAFIDAYVEGATLSGAYRSVYNTERIKEHTIHTRAHLLAKDEDVAAEIERRMTEKRERSIQTAADVTNEFLRLAFADPGDIFHHRRLCCRYCHGKHHRYQWKDKAEYQKALQDLMEENDARRRAKPPKRERPLPGDDGGYGFAFNAPPAADCPECRGEGKEDFFITDTTKLTPEQRRLIARIKVTKDGIEIRLRSQSDALTKAGQMLGGFKQTVVLQNPDGSPVDNKPVVITMSPEDAQAQYLKWMNGNDGSK